MDKKPEIKMYDPYKIVDPTRKTAFIFATGRTSGGRFAGYHIEIDDTPDNFPIDGRYWSRPARWNRDQLDKMRGEMEFRRLIVNDETVFSYRMLCEMYEHARDALLAGKSDEEAIEAAHAFLREKQYQTARTCLDRLTGGEGSEMNAIDASEVLSNWFAENWDLIPEAKL